ncbi:hypothetical protein HN51_058256 [Arachis hypogaea]
MVLSTSSPQSSPGSQPSSPPSSSSSQHQQPSHRLHRRLVLNISSPPSNPDEENGVVSGASDREKQLAEEHSNNDVKTRMATTVQKHDDGDQIQASSNEACVIEKHDPDKKCEEH